MLKILVIKSSMLSKFHLSSSYETIIVLPAVDMTLASNANEIMKRRTKQDGLLLVVEDDIRLGFIMVSNMVYLKTVSRYFCYVAQNSYSGEFWLDYGLETIKKAKC